MGREIERKFLVEGDFKKDAFQKKRIIQGYFSTSPGRTVRIRVSDDNGFITIKGGVHKSWVGRYEWEKKIDLHDAQELMELCDAGVIEKTRYLIACGNHTFEVDEFYGDNEGLVIAEVELESVDETFETPKWLAREVTHQRRYYNASLARNPYKNWTKNDRSFR